MIPSEKEPPSINTVGLNSRGDVKNASIIGMTLIPQILDVPNVELPDTVLALLREADERIADFQAGVTYQPASGFLASDFTRAYAALVKLQQIGAGDVFCEWGAGFGVVACLSASLGFVATGIEAQETLVDEGMALAEDLKLEVELVHGSFVTSDAAAKLRCETTSFLDLKAPDGFESLGRTPGEIDVTYVFAWPHEEDLIKQLFDIQASPGNFLVTYEGNEELVILRKE